MKKLLAICVALLCACAPAWAVKTLMVTDGGAIAGPIDAEQFARSNNLTRGNSFTNIILVDSPSNFVSVSERQLYICFTNQLPGGGGSGPGGIMMSNAWSVLYSDGATTVVELALGEPGKAFVSTGPTSAPVFQWPTVPLTNFVPLTAYEQYRQVYYDAVRSTFYAMIPVASNVPYTSHPSYTNTYPIPGYDGGVVWGYVARGGVDGDVGAPGAAAEDGTDGLNGFGYMQYGPWQSGKGYAYDTNSLVVVSYGGRWYDCIQSSTGISPSAVGASNYWSASIYSAMDGALYSTNLTDRGPWSSSETGYRSNDVVAYLGNTFYAHTNHPGVGTPPSVDADGVGYNNAYWDVRTKRGMRGKQGLPGEDGEVINLTNIVQWTILDAGPSVVVTNVQDSTNRAFYFDYWVSGVVGGTGIYHWGREGGGGTLTNETDPAFSAWLGTNAYTKVEVDPGFYSWLETNTYLTGVSIVSGDADGVATDALGHATITYVPGSPAGAGVATRILGGEATTWTIFNYAPTNLAYYCAGGLFGIDFMLNVGGGFVDQVTILASNVVLQRLVLEAYAYGVTGSVNVVTDFNGARETNMIHLSGSTNLYIVPFTNASAAFAHNRLSWGVFPGTATNDCRVPNAQIEGVW